MSPARAETLSAPTTSMPAPTPTSYERARALAAFGFFDEALTEVKRGLTEPAAASSTGWEDLADDTWVRVARANELLRFFIAKSWPLLGLLAVLGTAIVLARRKTPLDVGGFTSAVPELPNVGVGLTEAVETHLLRLGQAREVRHLGFVENSVEPLELPAQVSSLAPEVTGLLSLLKYVLPRRGLELTGLLHHHFEKGAGITARIAYKQSKQLLGCTTIWQGDVGSAPRTAPAAAYADLAEAVAIWTYWTIFERMVQDADREKQLRRAFGTSDWKSYMRFRASAAAPPGSSAREQHLRASLRDDPDNRFALLNLGIAVKAKLAEDAARCFEAVIALAEGIDWDATRILARYELATQWLNDHCRTPNSAVLGHARRVLRDAMAEASNGAHDSLTDRGERISEEAKESLAIMFAHAVLIDPNNVAPADLAHAQRLVRDIEAKAYLPSGVQFNLACHYSNLVGQGAVKGPQASQQLDRSFAYLAASLRGQPSWAADVMGDPSLAALCAAKQAEVAALLASFPSA